MDESTIESLVKPWKAGDVSVKPPSKGPNLYIYIYKWQSLIDDGPKCQFVADSWEAGTSSGVFFALFVRRAAVVSIANPGLLLGQKSLF